MNIKLNKKVHRLNISGNSEPVGHYTHITKIDPNASLYTFSGQIGTSSDGSIPKDFNSQVKNTFLNMKTLLNEAAITADDVIKVNIWATEQIDWEFFYQVYDDFFGNPAPSMTVGYLAALGLAEIKIEIELWAAK